MNSSKGACEKFQICIESIGMKGCRCLREKIFPPAKYLKNESVQQLFEFLTYHKS